MWPHQYGSQNLIFQKSRNHREQFVPKMHHFHFEIGVLAVGRDDDNDNPCPLLVVRADVRRA